MPSGVGSSDVLTRLFQRPKTSGGIKEDGEWDDFGCSNWRICTPTGNNTRPLAGVSRVTTRGGEEKLNSMERFAVASRLAGYVDVTVTAAVPCSQLTLVQRQRWCLRHFLVSLTGSIRLMGSLPTQIISNHMLWEGLWQRFHERESREGRRCTTWRLRQLLYFVCLQFLDAVEHILDYVAFFPNAIFQGLGTPF